MPKATKKKTFVRTEISPNEKRLGAGILVLLAAVGVTIAVKGHVYDPAKFSVDPANISPTNAGAHGL